MRASLLKRKAKKKKNSLESSCLTRWRTARTVTTLCVLVLAMLIKPSCCRCGQLMIPIQTALLHIVAQNEPVWRLDNQRYAVIIRIKAQQQQPVSLDRAIFVRCWMTWTKSDFFFFSVRGFFFFFWRYSMGAPC